MPSLLCPWVRDFAYKYDPNFNLGMGDWIIDEDELGLPVCRDKENDPTSSACVSGPSAKRKRLSLKLPGRQRAPLSESSNQFAVPVTSKALEKQPKDCS